MREGAAESALVAEDIHKSFGSLEVLKGVSLTAHQGDVIAMLGSSGSGKMDYYPARLSGGQQQRAAIARALAMEPEVMLFDEPMSALDPELIGEVLRVIRRLADEGRTMIVVTHEVGFAREVSNHAVFLHEGRIEEEGPPNEIFDNQKSERFRQFLSSHLH